MSSKRYLTRLIFATFLIFPSLFSEATAQNFIWGDPVDISGSLDEDPVIFGDDSTSLYVFYSRTNDFYIDKIRKDNLSHERNMHFRSPYIGSQMLIQVAFINGASHLFVSRAEGGSVSLYCFKVGDNIPFQPQKLMSVPWFTDDISRRNFDIIFSPDKSKFAIVTDRLIKGNKSEMSFTLFNDKMEQIHSWKSEYDDEFNWSKSNGFDSYYTFNHEMSIDDKGNLFYFRTILDGRTWLFSYSGESHKERVLFLNLTSAEDGALAIPAAMDVKGDKIQIVGNAVEFKAGREYYALFKNRKILGTFAMEYSIDSNAVVSQITNRFQSPLDLYDDIFIPFNCFNHSDGSYTLLNELQYASSNSADYAQVCLTHHSADGKLIWYKQLPVVFRPDMKHFDGFRYAAIGNENEFHFFMNDPAFNSSFIVENKPNIASYSKPLHFIFENDQINYPNDYRRSALLLNMTTKVSNYTAGDNIWFLGKKGKYYRIGSYLPQQSFTQN